MLGLYVPAIDLNINQTMCYRCNRAGLPRARGELAQLFAGKSSKCRALCACLLLSLLTSDMLNYSRGEQFTRVVKPPKAHKLFAIYPVSCLFIGSLNAGPIRLIMKEAFKKNPQVTVPSQQETQTFPGVRCTRAAENIKCGSRASMCVCVGGVVAVTACGVWEEQKTHRVLGLQTPQ